MEWTDFTPLPCLWLSLMRTLEAPEWTDLTPWSLVWPSLPQTLEAPERTDSTPWPHVRPFSTKMCWTGSKVLTIGKMPWRNLTDRPLVALAGIFWTGVRWELRNKVRSIAGSDETDRPLVISWFNVVARVSLMEWQPKLAAVACE